MVLKYGQIYDVKLGASPEKIKAIYIGKLSFGRKKLKHIILTRKDLSNMPEAYRFNNFKLKGLELSLIHFVNQDLTDNEIEYAYTLLQKKNL
ncbi:hypothetical protein BMS3Abin17_00734 [archaeon BMS3Abin17]|nr:hypothetical protein BMS3Abin17_00734 [archaeon BMS3Abin17]HDZ60892.1 hypothetical protein [Candidatus Pacearchaeota archaeon]